jgi:hypothetical protein
MSKLRRDSMFSSSPEWCSVTIDYGVQVGGEGGVRMYQKQRVYVIPRILDSRDDLNKYSHVNPSKHTGGYTRHQSQREIVASSQ